MGFSRQEYWSGLPFPYPVDHILSELSTMTCLSWVALHGMAHSFMELDKGVVHVIREVQIKSDHPSSILCNGQCPIFLLLYTIHGVRIQKWLPFPSPVDHVLSELSTMALHGMAHSFIELNKAVVHVIRLVGFLWLWFSFMHLERRLHGTGETLSRYPTSKGKRKAPGRW